MMFDDVDGDGTGMGAIPDEREDDIVNTYESYGEEEQIVLKDMQVDEVSGIKQGRSP